MIPTPFPFNYFLYLIIPFAFLIGSIPFGIIFTRHKNIDIRSAGSKNIGATNVLRTAGKTPAVLTLLGDMFKGALAVLLCKLIIVKMSGITDAAQLNVTLDVWMGISGLAVVLGHMYSVFLSFKGGKGVATGFGVFIVYSPAVAGISLLVWILVALISKYSSLAAIVAVINMPIALFAFNASAIKIVVAILIAVIIIIKHKSNIKKLLSGTESKIGKKGRECPPL